MFLWRETMALICSLTVLFIVVVAAWFEQRQLEAPKNFRVVGAVVEVPLVELKPIY